MRRLTLTASLLFLAVLAFSAGGRGAFAELADAPDRREIQARVDFAAGRYQKAVDTFTTLLAETTDPVFLRNIGRCYQKMKRPREAIDSFREYLQKGLDLTADERREIRGYIKEMQALEATSLLPAAPEVTPARPVAAAEVTPARPVAAAEPPPSKAPEIAPAVPPIVPASPKVPEIAAVVAPIVPRTTVPSNLVDTNGPSAAANRRWRVAGIATGISGFALLAVGAAYGLATRSATEQGSTVYDPSTDRVGKRDERLQWVGYGVGAAALATGAWLYVRGVDRAQVPGSAPPASLRAQVGFEVRGGSLSLRAAF